MSFPQGLATSDNLSIIIGAIIAVFLLWLGYIADKHPKSDNSEIEYYVDDYLIRKVEIFDCKLDWGTRLFPYRRLKIDDISVSADALIRYTPPEGIEEDLPAEHFKIFPTNNNSVKTVKLVGRNFFRPSNISRVRMAVRTPINRDLYARNVSSTFSEDQHIISITNNNSEQIRHFKYLLARPVKLSNMTVVDGVVNSFGIEVPVSDFNSVRNVNLGELDSHVSMSLILDLPPKRNDDQPSVVLRMS